MTTTIGRPRAVIDLGVLERAARLGLSEAECADLCGISPATLKNQKRDDPAVEQALIRGRLAASSIRAEAQTARAKAQEDRRIAVAARKPKNVDRNVERQLFITLGKDLAIELKQLAELRQTNRNRLINEAVSAFVIAARSAA